MKLNFYILLLCLSSIGITSWGRNATPTSHLTVLQLNIWHEGSIVEGGFEAIADEVAQVDADIVFFSEVRNYNGTFFISRINLFTSSEPLNCLCTAASTFALL